MDPQQQCGHTPDCPASGPVGQGNIGVHSQQEHRYLCHTGGRTVAASSGTACYRLRTAAAPVALVLTLLCQGCPPQASVAAVGLDERTVAAWLARAGAHGQRVHAHLVPQGHVDLPPVQADARWVKRVGQRVWMALALAVPSRRWLGGTISPRRDLVLSTGLVQPGRACARHLNVLVCVDGLSRYITAFLRGFRTPVYTGRRGRPRRVLAAGFLLGQVVKPDAKRRVVGVTPRVVQGTADAIAAVLAATGTGQGLPTAYRARLQATCRSARAPLVRRGRASAHQVDTLAAGRDLVGRAYNFCWAHARLRVRAPGGTGRKWQERTPAMAAGLTDHRGSLHERLRYPVPLPVWVPPKRRGRPPTSARPPTLAVAS